MVVPRSEARQWVPDERGLEMGNFVGAGDRCLASLICTDLTQMAGNFRYSRLHHIGRLGGLTPCCVQYPPSLDRRRLAPLGRHLIVQDSGGSVGCQLAIDCHAQAPWERNIRVDRS